MSSTRSYGSTSSVEGCPVIESGAPCTQPNTFAVIKEFKGIFDNCVAKIEENLDVDTKTRIQPLILLMNDVWQQNDLLIKTVEDLENFSINQMHTVHRRFEQKEALSKFEMGKVKDEVSSYKEDTELLLSVIKILVEGDNLPTLINLRIVDQQRLNEILASRKPHGTIDATGSVEGPKGYNDAKNTANGEIFNHRGELTGTTYRDLPSKFQDIERFIEPGTFSFFDTSESDSLWVGPRHSTPQRASVNSIDSHGIKKPHVVEVAKNQNERKKANLRKRSFDLPQKQARQLKRPILSSLEPICRCEYESEDDSLVERRHGRYERINICKICNGLLKEEEED